MDRSHYYQSQGGGGRSPFSTPRSRGSYTNGDGGYLGRGGVEEGFHQGEDSGIEPGLDKALPHLSISKTYSDSLDPSISGGGLDRAHSRSFEAQGQYAMRGAHHSYGRGSPGDAYAFSGRHGGRGDMPAAGYSPARGRGGPVPVRSFLTQHRVQLVMLV
jgi:hypothetical protein